MAQSYKILGQLGFEKYDELLRGRLKGSENYTTPEQIEELFPNNNDPNEENNNGEENGGGENNGQQNEEPQNLTVNRYIVKNPQENSPYAIVEEYSDDTLIRTTNITTITFPDINNHLSFRSKGAYIAGELPFYIYTLVRLSWNNTTYNANQQISEYRIKTTNTVTIL